MASDAATGARHAAVLREMGRRGESAYPCLVDGEGTFDMPAHALTGRSGVFGRTFTGYVDVATGRMRVDCAEDAGFWLEVDLSAVPGFAAAPGGPAAREAEARFAEHAEREAKKRGRPPP